MAAPFISWSFSRWHSFRECPKQVWHNNVAPKGHPDRIPYVQNQYQKAGEEVDTALTNRIRENTPLPPAHAHLEPIADVLASAPGNKYGQLDLGFTQAFEPCGTRDWDRCWLRVKVDFAVLNGSYAWFVDYKNGKISPDENQLKLYAAAAFMYYPEPEVIDTDYVWLTKGKTTERTYHRREAADLWSIFLPDVERMQVAYQTEHWPATPESKTAWGGSVCTYCNVNQAGKCPVAAVRYGEHKR